jgi:2-oxo-4-hydroxy-4-carboxy--5-ureidoimidazoline (OHCU) decarboxylase
VPFFENLALPEILRRFMEAEAAGDSKPVVLHYRALLTQEADDMLVKLARKVRAQPGAERQVQDLRQLLERCREIGTDAAYQERSQRSIDDPIRDALADLIAADSKEEIKAALTAHPELQSEAADQRLAELGARKSGYGADRFDAWRELLRRCREDGIDAAIEAYLNTLNALENPGDIFGQLMNATTPQEQRDLIRRHPVLLSRQIAKQIDVFVEAAKHAGDKSFLGKLERMKRALKTS